MKKVLVIGSAVVDVVKPICLIYRRRARMCM